jgi:hypothetical protein
VKIVAMSWKCKLTWEYPRLFFLMLLVGAGCGMPISSAHAASCCGGGGGSSLVLPKYFKVMAEIASDLEQYHGFWNNQGDYLANPSGSDLWQYRMNLGLAARLASRWQLGLIVPYIWNDNRYSGVTTQSNSVGDMTMNVWYESFDGVTCISKVRNLKDLRPAAYFGTVLTVPTGISPYDENKNSMDITGRGFYRIDGNILLEKTVYPFNVSLLLGLGAHFERPVNREYGKYVEPYYKKLGNRAFGTFSFGYTHFLKSMHALTGTLAYAYLREGTGTLNGSEDPITGMEKQSVAATLSFSTAARDWVFRTGWNHALPANGWGENFPATNTYSLGVSRVFL